VQQVESVGSIVDEIDAVYRTETAVNTQPTLRFSVDAFMFYFSVLVLWREGDPAS